MFFDTEKKVSERTIQDCSVIVEAFFRKVNVDPARQRFQTNNGCGWTIKRGSATIYILLGEVNTISTIRVVAPI